MKGLDARLGALERVYGADDAPVHIIVVALPGASESDIEAAKEQAMRERPGRRFCYVVALPRHAEDAFR